MQIPITYNLMLQEMSTTYSFGYESFRDSGGILTKRIFCRHFQHKVVGYWYKHLSETLILQLQLQLKK